MSKTTPKTASPAAGEPQKEPPPGPDTSQPLPDKGGAGGGFQGSGNGDQESDQNPPSAKLPATLEIISKSGVFRRAGREFSTTPITVPLSELTASQIVALKGEARLLVREVTAG